MIEQLSSSFVTVFFNVVAIASDMTSYTKLENWMCVYDAMHSVFGSLS